MRLTHQKLRELADGRPKAEGDALFEIGSAVILADSMISKTADRIRDALDDVMRLVQTGRPGMGMERPSGNEFVTLVEALAERNVHLRELARLGVDVSKL